MYGDLSVLRARAGRLAPAWSDTTDPDDADLQRFLEEASAQIDVALGGQGLVVPVTHAASVSVLAGLEADGALMLAIPATWPHGTSDEASELLKSVTDRWNAAMSAIATGKFSVCVALASTGDDSGPGATAHWIEEPYYPVVGLEGDVWNPLAAPGAYRGQRY